MAEIYSLFPGALCQAGSLVRLVHFLPSLCDATLRPWIKGEEPANSPLKIGSRKAIDHLTALITGYHYKGIICLNATNWARGENVFLKLKSLLAALQSPAGWYILKKLLVHFKNSSTNYVILGKLFKFSES